MIQKVISLSLFVIFFSCKDKGNKKSNQDENVKIATEKVEYDKTGNHKQIDHSGISGVYKLSNPIRNGRISIYQTKSGSYLGYLTYDTGAPSYNMGKLAGCIKKHDDKWILRGVDFEKHCEVIMSIQDDTVVLNYDVDSEGCFFGVNVNPTGSYLKSYDDDIIKSMFEEIGDCVINVLGDNEDQKINYCDCEKYETIESDYIRKVKGIKDELSGYLNDDRFDFTSNHYGWDWKEYWLNSLDSIIGILHVNPQDPLIINMEQKIDFTGDGIKDKLEYFVGFENENFTRGLKLTTNNKKIAALNLTDETSFENLFIKQSDFIMEMNDIIEDNEIIQNLDDLTGALHPWMCLLLSNDLNESYPTIAENNVLKQIFSQGYIPSEDETLNYIRNYKGLLILREEWGFDGSFYIIWHKPSAKWLKFSAVQNNNLEYVLGDFEYMLK